MASTRLSVNINKYALLRNARGGGTPDLLHVTDVCVAAGAEGITVHPRFDQRHIRFEDVPIVWRHLQENHPGIEYNIECEDRRELIELVLGIVPHQCTLVPVTPGEITSDHGWDLPRETERLKPTIARLQAAGIRVSLFCDPVPEGVARFADTGADCVELYTGPYAWAWGTDQQAVETEKVRQCTEIARRYGLLVNAGHDLDRHNLAGLRDLEIAEVSIGHAQICRALDVGTTQSVQELLAALA